MPTILTVLVNSLCKCQFVKSILEMKMYQNALISIQSKANKKDPILKVLFKTFISSVKANTFKISVRGIQYLHIIYGLTIVLESIGIGLF